MDGDALGGSNLPSNYPQAHSVDHGSVLRVVPPDDGWHTKVSEALDKLREPCTPVDRSDARLLLVAALRASGAGTRQEEPDTLHWLRGEMCDLLDITVGDDQYPWNAILEKLKTRLAESRPNE